MKRRTEAEVDNPITKQASGKVMQNGSFVLMDRLYAEGWVASLKAPWFKVLFGYAHHAKWTDNGYIAWPGPASIADKVGMSERSVKKYIKQLREAGYLVQVSKGGGRNIPSTYRIDLPLNGVPHELQFKETVSYGSTKEGRNSVLAKQRSDLETVSHKITLSDRNSVPVGHPNIQVNNTRIQTNDVVNESCKRTKHFGEEKSARIAHLNGTADEIELRYSNLAKKNDGARIESLVVNMPVVADVRSAHCAVEADGGYVRVATKLDIAAADYVPSWVLEGSVENGIDVCDTEAEPEEFCA